MTATSFIKTLGICFLYLGHYNVANATSQTNTSDTWSNRSDAGYLRLAKGEGTSAIDFSGYKNTGASNRTATGVPSFYSAGEIGPWAKMFDGAVETIAGKRLLSSDANGTNVHYAARSHRSGTPTIQTVASTSGTGYGATPVRDTTPGKINLLKGSLVTNTTDIRGNISRKSQKSFYLGRRLGNRERAFKGSLNVGGDNRALTSQTVLTDHSNQPGYSPLDIGRTQNVPFAVDITPPYVISAIAHDTAKKAESMSAETVAATPTFTDTGNTFASAAAIHISCTTPSSIIYYTVGPNGSTPTPSSSEFSQDIQISQTETIEAICTASGYANSAIASTTVSVAPIPTYSIPQGIYETPQSVALSCTAPSSIIYYVVNSPNTPTESSTVYSSPVIVSSSSLIASICSAPGYVHSPPVGSTYVITTAQTSTPIVQFTVNAASPGRHIPSNFLGLSYPTTYIPETLFDATDTSLVNLFNNLGPGTLRFGANNVEFTYWSRSAATTFPGAEVIIHPSDVDRLFAFAKAVGWKILYGLNLGADDPSMAADQASYVSSVAGNSLLAYEIGNEPNDYATNGVRSSTYNETDYESQFNSYLQAIDAAVPGAPISGPVTSAGSWLTSFVRDEHQSIVSVNQHFYEQAVVTPQLISTALPVSTFQATADLAQQYNLPLIMGETNSEYLGLSQGDISNTFINALWGLDYLFTLAQEGYSAAALYGGIGGCGYYSPLCQSNNTVVPEATYYAMLAFHYAVGQGATVVPVNFSTNQNISSYAVIGTKGQLSVVMINKDPSDAINAQISPGGTYADQSAVERLAATSLLATSTITFGGSSVNADGTWSATSNETAARSGSAYTVSVPAASAVVVVFQPFSAVAAAPGSPTVGTATAGNSQASTTFTAPASNGGATITSYTATSNPGGFTGTAASSPILVTGLANGTSYTFTVTATNSAGTGSASAPSNSVMPQAQPPQPGSISVVSGNGQTALQGTPFAAPLVAIVKDTSGSPLSNVTITFNVSGSASLSTTFAVTGLDGTAQATATPTAAGVITISASVNGLYAAAIFNETGLSTSAVARLSVLPSALTFAAIQGGANPLPASIALSNVGTGTLPWTALASGNPPWLAVGAASGITPAVMVASVNAAGLAAGSYQSTITVTSASQQQTVAVVLTVLGPTPALIKLVPAALVVKAVAGTTTTISRSISVTNAGSGALAWTATARTGSSSDWLSIISSSSGTTPSTVTVQLDSSGLAAGQYLGNIEFSDQGVALSTIAVVLNVSALPDLISSVPVLEFRGPVGSSFEPQTLPVSTTTDASVSLTAIATVTTGMDWLALGSAISRTPASLTALVNTGGLAAGYYVGYISVQSPGAQNALLVPVVLDLGSATLAGALYASPGGVLLTGQASSSQSAWLSQTIALSSDDASYSWNAVALASAQGTWLSVSPAAGSGNGPITLTANLAGLQPGIYMAQVAISATGTSNLQLIIPVTLIVSSGTTMVTSTNTLQTVQPAGDFVASVDVPVPLQVSILSPTGTPVSGANAQVAFSTGDAPVILTDVGSGTYTGVWTPVQAGPVSLQFASLGAPAGVVTGVISPPAGKQPVLTENGFVSAASFVSGMPLGIGSISALFGHNLALQTATAANFPLPLSLGGASLTINGIASPLFYASPTQINFFVPYELAGQTTAMITVSTSAGVAEVADVPLAPQSPGIFLLDAPGDAAAVHLDGQIVSVTAPASGGEVLEIFATGLGPVSNAPRDGAAAQSEAVAVDQIPPGVNIGGVESQVLFAGLAPGFVGLYQIDAVVPVGLPEGPAVLTIAAGSLFSNSAVLQLR